MYFEGEYISVPQRIGNWLLQDKLGSGFSGAIYKAVNPYNGQVAAVKLQHIDHECPTNQYERLFYPALQGGIGMPTMWASGVHGVFDYLVIDLLGPSLDNLYRQTQKIMDLRSVLSIGMQVLSRLEFMHTRGILHRDIQLGNCVIGLGPYAGTIFMIDFGFSKFYLDRHTHKHIPDSRKKRDFIGNYWFSSVNVHCRGRVPSRRDDLEALALMLIHLLTPNGLPWTRNGVPKYSEQGDKLISEKLRARPEDLCHGLPDVFEDFLRYCRRLKFAECPDYAHWRSEFAALADEHGFVDYQGHVTEQFFWPPIVPAPVQPPQPVVNINTVLRDIAKMNLDDGREVVRNIASQQLQHQRQELQDDSDEDEDESESDGESETSIKDMSNTRPSGPAFAQRPAPPLSAPANSSGVAPVPTVATLSDGSTTDSAPRTPVDEGRGSSTPSLRRPGPSVASGTDVNVENPAAPSHTEPTNVVPPSKAMSQEVIVISSGDEDVSSKQQVRRTQKATSIKRLTAQVAKAVDNVELCRLMQEFIQVLQSNSSKFMTKDGFTFLDALESQLSDPDVFLVDSKQRAYATRSADPLQGIRRHASQAETMKFLRQRIMLHQTMTNPRAGEMLGAFTKALRKSGARTVTKDGFAFLVGLEAFLQRT